MTTPFLTVETRIWKIVVPERGSMAEVTFKDNRCRMQAFTKLGDALYFARQEAKSG